MAVESTHPTHGLQQHGSLVGAKGLAELIEHSIQGDIQLFRGVVASAGDLAAQFGDAIGADFAAVGDTCGIQA